MSAKHAVEFYETDSFLIASIIEFIRRGDIVLIIATQDHAEKLSQQLESVNAEFVKNSENYVVLDASKTLSGFMRSGMPDQQLFLKTVGTLVVYAVKDGKKVRAFSEMVAILASEGNLAGAIKLEEMWNSLQKLYSFSLLCAYPVEILGTEISVGKLADICEQHSRVVSLEN